MALPLAPADLRILNPVATVTGARDSLQAINTSQLPDRAIVQVASNDAQYQLRKFSTDAPVGDDIVAPAQGGPGRWFKFAGSTIDINSDEVDNVSDVSGISVSDALDTLNDQTPTPIKTKSGSVDTTQTLVVADGNRCVINGPLAGDITLTLGTAGAGFNEGYIIERRDTTSHQVTVINGGPAGPGGPGGGPSLYVFPGSQQRSSSFLFDAADWSQGTNLAIVVP